MTLPCGISRSAGTAGEWTRERPGKASPRGAEGRARGWGVCGRGVTPASVLAFGGFALAARDGGVTGQRRRDGRRGAPSVRSGAGAILEKHFWRRSLPYPLTITTLTSPAIAVAPAETVTCRATMDYRGGEEGLSAGLGEPCFSYERRSEATKDPVGSPPLWPPRRRTLFFDNLGSIGWPPAARHGPGGLRPEFSRPGLRGPRRRLRGDAALTGLVGLACRVPERCPGLSHGGLAGLQRLPANRARSCRQGWRRYGGVAPGRGEARAERNASIPAGFRGPRSCRQGWRRYGAVASGRPEGGRA